jgi:hypothetical protein
MIRDRSLDLDDESRDDESDEDEYAFIDILCRDKDHKLDPDHLKSFYEATRDSFKSMSMDLVDGVQAKRRPLPIYSSRMQYLNGQDDKGRTPLMMALASQHPSTRRVASDMIQMGARLDLVDHENKSVIDYAI